MKRVWCALLCAVLVFALCACGSQTAEETSEQTFLGTVEELGEDTVRAKPKESDPLYSQTEYVVIDRAVFAEMEGMTPLHVGDSVSVAYEEPFAPPTGDAPPTLQATRCISVITS